MKAYDVLEQFSWCKGAFARNSHGDVCRSYDPAATSFCIMGAITRQYKFEEVREIVGLLRDDGIWDAIDWNDHQISVKPVLEVLRRLNI